MSLEAAKCPSCDANSANANLADISDKTSLE